MAKSFTTDRATLANSKADSVDRVAALQRLLSDGVVLELRSIVEPWIHHDDGLLRNAGLNYVLSYLSLDNYVPIALDRLRKRPEEDEAMEAGMAAYALGHYLANTQRQRREICSSLISTLEQSNDEHTQRSCYEALLRAEGDPFPDIPTHFSKNRDIDWELVNRIRAQQ